jgi:hypothetical protein
MACGWALLSIVAWAHAGDSAPPLLLSDNFEKGIDAWQPNDPQAWKQIDVGGEHQHVFSHFKQANYKPKYRSPVNYALLKKWIVSDFTLEADCQSTVKPYDHQDLCLFFGYQGPDQYYYSHLGKKTDDHANQIFIVNKAERTKISTKTTPGTPWTEGWHHVKVVRTIANGRIAVYFDDMKEPVQTAADKTFAWGQVGIGSFDDLGNWDNVKLSGIQVEKK